MSGARVRPSARARIRWAATRSSGSGLSAYTPRRTRTSSPRSTNLRIPLLSSPCLVSMSVVISMRAQCAFCTAMIQLSTEQFLEIPGCGERTRARRLPALRAGTPQLRGLAALRACCVCRKEGSTRAAAAYSREVGPRPGCSANDLGPNTSGKPDMPPGRTGTEPHKTQGRTRDRIRPAGSAAQRISSRPAAGRDSPRPGPAPRAPGPWCRDPGWSPPGPRGSRSRR